MPVHLILDPNSENSPDPGTTVINDELTFLKTIGVTGELFVKGRFLCNWASEVGRARGWRVDWRAAPSSELRQACPSLSEEMAKSFLARFNRLDLVRRPISLMEIAVMRWPEIDPEGKSEVEQARSWLIWRAGTELDLDEQIVATSLANSSFTHVPALKVLYVDDKEQAWKRIKEWLRCEPASIEIPSWEGGRPPAWVIARLKEEWKLAAVRSRGIFFLDLLKFGAPQTILQEAASMVATYFRLNREHLTVELLTVLKPFVPYREWTNLRQVLPAKDPGAPPVSIPELFSWFSEDYLNYRCKNPVAAQSADRIRELGREFGLWYLGFYSNARTGGEGSELMSWSKTAQFANDPGYVKLLLVLDGLGYIDAKQITEFISSECSRLALDDLEIVLAPLPTVTHFAKPALMAGVTPVQAFEEKEIGAVETRDLEVIRALNEATAGQVVIWSVLEPDVTYHKPLEAQTIRYEVEGRLRSIARRVARIANEVEDMRKLRLVITTDHGRLLSGSRRVYDIPRNMQGHGRAAWGQVAVPFNADGIFVDGDLAYIDAGRFGLPETVAIVLSDDAFRTSDGRSGMESFAHGGVFPEEVLIPWVTFTRDRVPVRVELRLSGTGQAGAAGKVRLDVTNTSEVRIEIVELRLPFVSSPIEAHVNVGALSRSSVQWTVINWPHKTDLPSMQATVVCALPNGEREFISVIPDLAVEEMYSRDPILDDLL